MLDDAIHTTNVPYLASTVIHTKPPEFTSAATSREACDHQGRNSATYLNLLCQPSVTTVSDLTHIFCISCAVREASPTFELFYSPFWQLHSDFRDFSYLSCRKEYCVGKSSSHRNINET